MATRREYLGDIRAPEFPPNLEWLNTGRPLTLGELRGKRVLLDFWTYGCINCMHVIPDLKRLEERYADVLVVIGVHSAKFQNERDLDNIRQIILRYGVEHPVVNDRDMAVWQAYAVRAWPTTVLIGPTGRVLAAHSGEGVWQAYAEVIERAVTEFDAQGLLNHVPLDLRREAETLPETALSFPGKVLADEASRRLFVADTAHHRIVVLDLEGEVLDVIGSGAEGLADGTFEQARLARPQGMALDGETLYIADTENHALRAADLRARTLSTVAGNGTLAYREAEQDPRLARLNSPWDLALVNGTLYIAMAGTHQLWALDVAAGRIGPYAGSGREALLDAPLLRAALAQPSGLATDGQRLYFADSEASAVRYAELNPKGMVRTLVGEGLFDFGDVDGPWPKARLQHPLAVAYHGGVLYVADTYNHKLKRVDTQDGTVSTLWGDGRPGWRDGAEARFYEPGGLSAAGERLYVADTNNHVIRVVELASGMVRTLALRDPRGLLGRLDRGQGRRVWTLPEQQARPGPGKLRVALRLPEGHKLNGQAPSRWVWTLVPDDVVTLPAAGREVSLQGTEGAFEADVIWRPGRGALRAELAIYYCQSDESACLIELGAVELPLWVHAEAESDEISIDVPLPLPRSGA
jgi:thiol-disulfide isomerase/thioredoxin